MSKLFAKLLLMVFLVNSGCENPFATREPEAPVKIQSSWIQPTSPSYVMINLKNAISEKNTTNYLRCLSDTSSAVKSFAFIPEPAVANANPGLFTRWGKDAESNYLNQLSTYLPKDSTASVDFERLKETIFQDSVVLLQSYQLKVEYKCDESSCPRVWRGQAEFRLIRTEEDIWYIYKWSDYSTGDDLSWSSLKAAFGK